MFNSLSDTIILELFVPEAVIVVSGLNWKTSDSVSIHVLMEKQKENDSSTGKMVLDAVTFQLMLFTSSLRITILRSSALNVPVRLTEEEWSEIRDTTTGEGRRRGSGQSCCIFMVFLLTIILFHWFFKKMSGYYQNT
uniref:Uncharacterized protein n=1 Tax=Brassica campestris TaxID=3711 RepID=M4DE50_BRACM|nr:unnamed protein product [Brassica rapa]